MSSPFPPHRPFPVDLHLHRSAMEELDSFLLATTQHIDRILLRYTSPAPKHEPSDLRPSSPVAPTVTRTLLPNISHLLSAEPPSSSQTCVQDCSETSPDGNSASEQQEKASHGATETVDGSALKTFMEEILSTSQEWSGKQKLILCESVVETLILKEEASAMVRQSQRNTETAQARSSVEEPLPNSAASGDDDTSQRMGASQNEGLGEQTRFLVQQTEQYSGKDGGIGAHLNGEEAKLVDFPGSSGKGAETSFVTPTKASRLEKGNLSATEWVRPTSSSDMKLQPYRPLVEVIASPDWLPDGWITEIKTRSSGNSAGTKDKYYVEPVSKRRFRSRKEVFNFLETGKVNKYRKRLDTSPIRMLPEPQSTPVPTKQGVKRAKSRPTTTTTATPVAASSAAMSNMYVPVRPGQPSEWVVYESLASLPFPMFDSFHTNANKPNTSSKGPPVSTTRPWFFTGPEASWMPFSGMGKSSDDKSRDNQSPYSMPTYTPEPQKRRARKSSKRSS